MMWNECSTLSSSTRKNLPVKTLSPDEWEGRRREACSKLGQLFDSENLDKLGEDNVYDLLNFEKNQTMEARRVAPRLVDDIEKLRSTIKILTDESRDVGGRLNEVLKVPGMGPAVATMILFLRYPEKYPFWSSPKEEVLKEIGAIERLTETYGDKYEKIIKAEEKLSSDLNIDIITLDTFLWWIIQEGSKSSVEEEAIPFEAEEELRNYLSLHPEAIEKGLRIVENGTEYSTDVGNIDLLSKDKDGNFVVMELKKFRESDRALGQLQRYIGWVKEERAGGEIPRGILITHEFDEKLVLCDQVRAE